MLADFLLQVSEVPYLGRISNPFRQVLFNCHGIIFCWHHTFNTLRFLIHVFGIF